MTPTPSPNQSGSDRRPKPPFASRRSWKTKFADAIRGVGLGIRGQSSFAVHGFATLAVSGAAVFLQVTPLQWCVLLLCIALVVTAELLNSSIERLASAITDRYDDRIGAALDIASGAVLVASALAALIGLIILGPPLIRVLTSGAAPG